MIEQVRSDEGFRVIGIVVQFIGRASEEPMVFPISLGLGLLRVIVSFFVETNRFLNRYGAMNVRIYDRG